MDAEIPVSEARAQFAELVNRVGYGKERIVLTRHGKPLVALVPADDLTAAGDTDRTELDDPAAIVVDVSSRQVDPAHWTIAARQDRGPHA